MKKIVYILCFFPFFIFSQGIDLELNQVLLVSEATIVPEDKVWKITSALVTCADNCYAFLIIGESDVYVHVHFDDAGMNRPAANNPTKFPIWVPSGTFVNIGTNVSGISILEFNAEQ